MADYEGFEERIRAMARELSRSLEQRAAQVDIDRVADAIGMDHTRAHELVDNAVGWLLGQAHSFGDEMAAWTPEPEAGPAGVPGAAPAGKPGAGPHPLDHPTDEQGLALAALDSGRWTVGPGSHVIIPGDGPQPSDAVDLVGELRARDWIAADGSITLAGRHALTRWLDGGHPA